MKKFWRLFGDLKQIVGQLSIYNSIYSLLATSMLLWRIVLKPILDEYQLEISVGWFVLVGMIAMTILGALEHKKGLPGYYESAYRFSPMYDDIQQLKTDNDKLKQSNTLLVNEIQALRRELTNGKAPTNPSSS